MPHIDLARHATVHQLGARDPLDAFLDIVTAQSVTGQKTFTKPPYLGTAPTIGSHWAWGSYVVQKIPAVGSSFVALMQSNVFRNLVAGGGTIGFSILAQSQMLAALPGGTFGAVARAQAIGTHS